MTTKLALLERALEQLARDFTTSLIQAALRARVAELGPLLAKTSVEPSVFAVGPVGPSRVQPPVRPHRVPSPAGRSRIQKQRETARPTELKPARVVAERHSGDALANVITDPGLLLDVIAAGPRSSADAPSTRVRDPRRARQREPSPGVQRAQVPMVRPGEELQHTLGGNVVLRRGRK